MPKTKIEWAKYSNEEENENVFCEAIDKTQYNEKYKGHLSCINGCSARIKFTARRDGSKFFSTWNKEGDLHDKEYCPLNVKYRGKIGRKKLKDFYEDSDVSDEHIKGTIARKIHALKTKDNKEVENPMGESTLKIEDTGEMEVAVTTDSGRTGDNQEKRVYINSLEAKILTPDYIDMRLCIYGKISNPQICNNDSGVKYAYLNLDNTKYNVSAYLPEAFYAEQGNSAKLEQFITIVENLIDKGEELVLIAVGMIKCKKGGGLEVVIEKPEHLVINEDTYNEILLNEAVERATYSL